MKPHQSQAAHGIGRFWCVAVLALCTGLTAGCGPKASEESPSPERTSQVGPSTDAGAGSDAPGASDIDAGARAPSAGGAKEGTVRVEVVDPETALVEILDARRQPVQRWRTAAGLRTVILTKGQYHLRVAKRGFEPFEESLTITGDAQPDVRVTLTPQSKPPVDSRLKWHRLLYYTPNSDDRRVRIANAFRDRLKPIAGIPTRYTDASFSRDGRHVVFTRETPRAIFLMGTDGSKLTQLTEWRESDGHATISPDRSRIAWVKADNALHVMNFGGSGQKPYAEGVLPFWSPDGLLIGYINAGLHAISSSGRNPRKIADLDVSLDSRPDWTNTPKGARILYSARSPENGDGHDDVYSINPNDLKNERLTNRDAFDGRAVWAPGGKMIAFISVTRSGTEEIWVMNADGSDKEFLLTCPGVGTRLAWISGRR